MSSAKERMKFYQKRIQEGRLKEMKEETIWIYQYAKGNWKPMIFYTILGLSSAVVGLFSSFVSRDMVDIITGHKTGALLHTFIVMISIAIASIIINQVTGYISNRISMRVDAQIKNDVFEKILKTDWESLNKYHTGDLLTRWSSDAGAISSGVLNYIPSGIINVFRFISALAVVVQNDWTFAIFALLGIPVSLIMSRTLLTRMQSNNKKNAQMSARLSGFNQETFSNIQTIKAFSLIRLYTQYQKQLQEDYIHMRLDYQKLSMKTSMILSFVGLLVSYSCYGWGIYRVWTGAITYGTMTMFLTLSGTLTGSVNTLANMVPTAISLTTSARRLMDILNMPSDDYSQEEPATKFIEKYRSEGIGLKVEDLSYTYHNGNEVFHGASFEAKPHEIIGLVGPSGEGKTTMLRLILSLLRPQGGSIELVAKEESFPLSPSTRQAFSYVPQGNTMFSGTIASNMRSVKPDATDAEIISALQLACAWQFVEKLPNGIDTEVKERGGGFSEGQAQRLAIARALLRKSPLLLLDEASSALDVATERRVLRNIMKDDYPRACIVTTHRPTVLTMCTRVYEIADEKCHILSNEEIQKLIDDF